MGRIIAEMLNNEIVVTRYESSGGFIIPDNISQKKNLVAIIKGNLDEDEKIEELLPEELAVSREEFLMVLLDKSEECQKRYLEYGKGLYSSRDVKKGITWAEVAYLVYYVGGIDKSLDWNSIKPRKEDRVCILNEIVDGKKKLDAKLADYKNRLDMEYYIKSIIGGNRYIPLPMYCAFVDLCAKDDLNIDLNMDIMFKKLSKQELSELF